MTARGFAKGRLSRCNMPSIALQKTAFWKTKDGVLQRGTPAWTEDANMESRFIHGKDMKESAQQLSLKNFVFFLPLRSSLTIFAYRMKRDKIIERIKNLAMSTLPAGSSLFLYGSQARGDARIGSDWDLLILLDKPKLEAGDYGVAYPFRELGWEIGEEINPSVYTRQQWASWSFLPYNKNVERDKIVLKG